MFWIYQLNCKYWLQKCILIRVKVCFINPFSSVGTVFRNITHRYILLFGFIFVENNGNKYVILLYLLYKKVKASKPTVLIKERKNILLPIYNHFVSVHIGYYKSQYNSLNCSMKKQAKVLPLLLLLLVVNSWILKRERHLLI